MLSETQRRHWAYWSGLQTALDAQNGPVAGKTPQLQNYMSYPIGRTGFSLAAVAHAPKRFVRAELYITGGEAAGRLGRLEILQAEIERDLGYPLEWGDQSPTGRDRRISRYLREVDVEDKSDWPRQHQWLAERLNQLHRAFFERVRQL